VCGVQRTRQHSHRPRKGRGDIALEAQFARLNRHGHGQICGLADRGGGVLSGAPCQLLFRVWQAHSSAGLSYGFEYDDVNNQRLLIEGPVREQHGLWHKY